MLENIPLPNTIRFEETDSPNTTKVIIEPFYSGFGSTIGNSLRRVLLSSLPGGAIIGVKITGVDHEFASIDFVKEDVVDILLNLKKVALKVHSDEPVRMTLSVKGKKMVTAADFQGNADVEVVNPEHYICEVTDANGELEMEVICDQGRGYVPVEAREEEQMESGMLSLDAIYTPVLNVGIQVENVRVGQRTDYDRVVLTVETDGSISAQDAVHRSSNILMDHFTFISEGETAKDTTRESIEAVVELKDIPVEDINAVEQAEEGEAPTDEEAEPPKRKRGRPRKTETESTEAETPAEQE